MHGCQEGRFFHGYYDHYCFLPLYVFCGDQLLVSYLRPSNIDQAKHAWAILALLVKRLRQAWPAVRLTVRADSGFCRHKMLSWCERHEVGYMAKNARINDQAARGMALAAAAYERTGEKQRVFADLCYGARSWNKERRVSASSMLRRHQPPREGALRAPLLRPRRVENRIKEQQLALFADRTSCHKWWPNQFRLILSSLAYTLIATIRRLGLRGTTMARAQADTIRLKLLKIGAVVIRNTRRVRLQAPARTRTWSVSRQPGSSRDNRPLRSPTQTHKRCRRLPARAPLAQTGRNRLRRETGPTITSPKAPHH